MDERRLLKKLLKKTFSSSTVDKEEKENEEDIDSQLSSTCLRYITERIEFKPASHTDSYLEHLKKKYPPINTKIKMQVDPANEKCEEKASTGEKDNDGIPEPRRILYSAEKIEMGWKQVRGIGSGLTNMGNTCFLNSVLQCLCYTAPLHWYLKNGEHKATCSIPGFCAMCQLRNHVTRVMGSVGGTVRPVPIVQNIRAIAKHFRFGRQEDAHEFLRYLIDALQKCCLHGLPAKLDPYSKHTTLVHQIFGGYHRSQVKCLECHKTSNTYDPLLDISLDIKGCVSLARALSRSTKPDLLSGENKYACPFCKKLTQAQKKFTIHRLPNVLTFHLKRFDYNSLFGGKINKTVEYPEVINMRQHMSNTQGPDEWYRLYAVLVHFGFSCHSGHYYCYVRGPNGTWYCLNDSQVHQVSLNTALSQEAYLLFYSKETNHSPSTPTVKKAPVSSPPKFKLDPTFLSDQTSKHTPPPLSSKNTASSSARPKPTGVVIPSLQSSSAAVKDEGYIFELRKTTSPAVTPHKSPIPQKPPIPHKSPTPIKPQPTSPSPSQSPSTIPPKPAFTPRVVLKNTKPSASKSLFPPLSEDKPVTTQLGQSASHTSSPLKSPKVAMVQPQPQVGNKKPVARVLPSLKTPVKSITSQEAGNAETKDDQKEKEAVAFGPSLPADWLSDAALAPVEKTGGVGNDLVKFSLKSASKKNYRWASHHRDQISESDKTDDDRVKSKEKFEVKRDKTKSPFSNSSEEEENRRVKHRRKRRSSSSEYESDSKARKRDRHERTSKKRDHVRKKEHRSRDRDRHRRSDSRSDSEYIRREKTRTSDSRRDDSTECEESRTSSHEHSRTDKSRIDGSHKKTVPVVKWEDTVGMVAKAIDYSSSHSVVDSMTRKQDLGESVRSWDGDKNNIDSSKVEDGRKRKGRDDWDWELDRGKTKKSHSRKADHYFDKKNPFQDFKRSHHGRHDRHRHHNSSSRHHRRH